MAPCGERTQSEEETLDLLLATHFPDSAVVERGVVPAAAYRATCVDWRVAAGIIAYRRVEWAIDSFAPYKVWAWTGCSWPFCKRDGRSLFRTCLG